MSFTLAREVSWLMCFSTTALVSWRLMDKRQRMCGTRQRSFWIKLGGLVADLSVLCCSEARNGCFLAVSGEGRAGCVMTSAPERRGGLGSSRQVSTTNKLCHPLSSLSISTLSHNSLPPNRLVLNGALSAQKNENSTSHGRPPEGAARERRLWRLRSPDIARREGVHSQVSGEGFRPPST